MKEIEVKARLRNKNSVMKKLEALGCVFSDRITQNDVVYTEKTGSLKSFLSNKIFLRIRVNNGSKIIFTVKDRAGALVATEHEVVVDSKEEMRKIILLLGNKEAVRINKTRQTTEYNGCEICIDKVESLGTFIEMEKMTERGDAGKIQEELFTFFLSLGIKQEDRVKKGYDILMLEKSGK